MASRTKVLMVSHGHPDHTAGGGEIAAYNLHNALNARDEYESCLLYTSPSPRDGLLSRMPSSA